MADATTVVRWVQTIPPATLHALNDRVVELVRQARVTRGRTLRSAATTIHHPTDSSLLADGGRVLCSISRRRKPLVALPVLVSTRALAGLGAAIISGSSFAAVSDAFPVAVRDNRVIGLLLSVVGIAAVIGIPILTQIASVSGWRVAAAALNILLQDSLPEVRGAVLSLGTTAVQAGPALGGILGGIILADVSSVALLPLVSLVTRLALIAVWCSARADAAATGRSSPGRGLNRPSDGVSGSGYSSQLSARRA